MTRKQTRRDVIGAAGAAAGVAAASGVRAAEAPAIDLNGKTALITGASSGFGRLTALHLARAGATVVASMRNLNKGKRPEAVELAAIAAKEKLKLILVEIDVTKPAQVTSGVAGALAATGGRLDILVNNAGIGAAGPIEFNDEKSVFDAVDVNLLGYHRMARAVLPTMRKQRQGLVVSISSQLGRILLPNIGVYSATKFAVEAMFEVMAYELAPFGVESTIIQPGGYPTKIWENGRKLADAMMARADAERKTAYALHNDMASGLMRGEYTTDPMDVPRAIAEVFAMPVGKRPLRRPVHPNKDAMVAVNAAMAEIEARVLGAGPYKDWHAAVVD
jgi:NAD(P)-dependent dehydrogenase (short-subunit alcohol dehydrogenase family)